MSHISFSELKNWNNCSYYHKLVHVDGIKVFEGNEHTAFGTAIHDTCEQMLLTSRAGKVFDAEEFFKKAFLEESKQIEIKDKTLLKNMYTQGAGLLEHITPALEEYFKGFELISTEEKLYEDTDIRDYKFKGYIDLVLQTSDGKYHIIDWKTCSWGWNSQRKSEKMTTYQLTLYKNYWAQKHGIDPNLIETHFALLKRTAKKDKVELFRVTSGPQKTQNAIKLLTKAVYNIHNGNYIKNRLACRTPWGYCEFYKSSNCS